MEFVIYDLRFAIDTQAANFLPRISRMAQMKEIRVILSKISVFYPR